ERNRDTKEPTIFIYDGYRGGSGLSEKLHSLLPELLVTTLNLIEGCKCEKGCPSCIYSSKCGNNNEPLDKQTAIMLLKELIRLLPPTYYFVIFIVTIHKSTGFRTIVDYFVFCLSLRLILRDGPPILWP
ncbi:DUF1998 domain-containing protein, partial [Candidatus Bathyarchaeota archaeon]|nr:DUF1998 domain-containing protein [Candidatus Bathyarchaeota archaeon]